MHKCTHNANGRATRQVRGATIGRDAPLSELTRPRRLPIVGSGAPFEVRLRSWNFESHKLLPSRTVLERLVLATLPDRQTQPGWLQVGREVAQEPLSGFLEPASGAFLGEPAALF